MAVGQPTRNERIRGVLGAVAVHLLLGYVLIAGLAVDMPAAVDDGLKLFGIAPEPPPPPIEPVRPAPVRSDKREGAASPPNLTATPTQVVAPPPIIPLVIPPPVIAAPKAGIGSDPSAGAADIRGPGTGSGGVGDGTGSGGYGDGGGSGGDDTPPRWRRGRLSDSDYPREAAETGASGTVGVRYVVATDGRVIDCEVTDSSGYAELDDTTCRLILQRFRFEPSRDSQGRPVRSVIVENHSWVNN